MPTRFSRVATLAAVGLLAASLTGCSTGFSFGSSNDNAAATPTPTPTSTVAPFESVFSDMGSTHPTAIIGANLTLELDAWTEQKTHEWTAASDKSLSLVINVVDSAVPVDAAFALKRQVFMSNVTVTATPTTAAGTAGTPVVLLNVDPVAATLDPEALRSAYGLLITSPKGGFQLESTSLGALPAGTTGVTLDFAMTITSESAGGSNTFATQVVPQNIPIAIYTDEEAQTASAESSDGKN